MEQRVFVYGTLLAGEVNHALLGDARLLGPHRTAPRFTMLRLGAYPGVVHGGHTAIQGEVYQVDMATLAALDRLEDVPYLYHRGLIPTRWGRAWLYLYRGPLAGRSHVPSGDWRSLVRAASAARAAGVRGQRDAKNPRQRVLLASRSHRTDARER